MKQIIALFFALSFVGSIKAQNYINYASMHTQIDNTIKENKRQKKITETSATNLVLENQNKEQNGKLKEKYEAIRGRLSTIAPYMQAIPVSTSIYRSINDIISTQGRIIALLEESPLAVVELYTPYLTFAEDAYDTMGLATGIILTYGSLSQMEQDDRMMLLNHTKTEFNRLAMQSRLMYSKLRFYIQQQRYRQNVLENWVNKDIQIVRDIMTNYENLGF